MSLKWLGGSIHDPWIPLLPSIVLENLSCFFVAEATAIGTGTGHGVIGVGHGQDARSQGDSLSLQLIRIALTIVPSRGGSQL